MKKKITLFFCVFVAFTLKAQTGIPPTSGDGSPGNPYKIATWQNLVWISQNIVKWSAHYIQTADIDFSTATPAITTWDSNQGWYPIGGEIDFTGSYDGGNHTISGIYINRIATEWVGFFGSLSNCTIKNIGLINASVTGDISVGGLVGYAWIGCTVSNCYTTGSVTGLTQNVGGLIGSNDGSAGVNTISQCHSGSNVSGSIYAGGLIGNSTFGTINSCYATGAVSMTGNIFGGGLIGFSTSAAKDCYATGSVSCTNNTSATYELGGLIGYSGSAGGVSNCYATGSVLCTTASFKSAQLGGLIGYATVGPVTNCYATGSVTSSIYVYASNIVNEKIGGLIGLNESAVSSCYATGATYGGTYVGGLMGENNGSVSDCYSKGTVSSNGMGGYYGGLIGHNKSSVSKCYSISPIVNGATHPGLVGDNSGSVAGNCFWNSSINPVGYDNNSGTFSAVGKTTAQMQTASTFSGAGWSASTWSMIDNIYPALAAFLKAPTITTQPVSSISSATATGNGTISDLGYPASIASYGVCWNTTGTPLMTDNKNDNGVSSATGAFTAGLTGLVPNTAYFVRAFAMNNAVATYGPQVTFTTTAIAPAVSSVSATGITGTGVLLNGSVNANNSSTAVTFDYGITSSPYSNTNVASTPGSVTGTSVTSVSLAVTGLTPNTTYHFRVKGTNSAGTTNGTDLTFTTLAVVPTSTTIAATAITTNGATLNGNVNANNSSTNVTFDYGTTTTYSANSIATPGTVTGTSGTSVGYVLTGLKPNTTYHFRVNGVNSAGTTNGTDLTFTTTAAAPAVTTSVVSSVTTTGATLNGTVNANNASTAVTFDYGLTTSYGTTVTATQSPVTGTTATAVSYVLSGLIPNTTYHFRVNGVNVGGTTNGTDLTFTTTAAAPTVTTSAVSSVTTTGVTLNGTVNANNASAVVTFDYGLTTSYGTSVTATQSPVTGTTATAVSYAISGLVPNTTYHFRVNGVNTAGTTNGTDLTFSTTVTNLNNVKDNAGFIYPNPATDGCYINLTEETGIITIFTLSGIPVLSQQAKGITYINISSLDKGVYVVKANGLVGKLVKK